MQVKETKQLKERLLVNRLATCSPILIGRLAIDKTDPTVIDLHNDHFSHTVRKFGQEVVGLRS